MHREPQRSLVDEAASCGVQAGTPERTFRLAVAVWAVLCAVVSTPADVIAPKAESRQETTAIDDDAAGLRVPSFHVFAVTGPHMNQSVCYVCRNGQRPVVMVFSRRLSPALSSLLKGIDEIVDRHRAAGLRSFAVLLSDDARADAPRLQTLAFDERIDTPLTLAPTVMSRQPWLRMADESELCVVLYRNRRVLARHTVRPGKASAGDAQRVLDAVRTLAAEADIAAGVPRR